MHMLSKTEKFQGHVLLLNFQFNKFGKTVYAQF